MGRYDRQVFDINKPFLVRKAFKANGRTFTNGMPFDWSHMAITARKVRVLFDSGYLSHPTEKKAKPEKKAETKVEAKKEATAK